MPTYGQEKVRDMSRSLLPSRRRKGAREDKATVKRRVRHAVRARLKNCADFENADFLHDDPQHHGPYNVKEVVFDRRLGDNLGAIIRWAEAHADKFGDTPVERTRKIRSLLPDNIIGWHAMTHIEDLDAYETRPRTYYSWVHERARRARREQEQVARVLAVLHRSPWLHRPINQAFAAYGNRIEAWHPADLERFAKRIAGDVTLEALWSELVRAET